MPLPPTPPRNRRIDGEMDRSTATIRSPSSVAWTSYVVDLENQSSSSESSLSLQGFENACPSPPKKKVNENSYWWDGIGGTEFQMKTKMEQFELM